MEDDNGARRVVNAEPTRTCKSCGRAKPVSAFAPNKRSLDGIALTCDKCSFEHRSAAHARRRLAGSRLESAAAVAAYETAVGLGTGSPLRELLMDWERVGMLMRGAAMARPELGELRDVVEDVAERTGELIRSIALKDAQGLVEALGGLLG